jgi:hypothetical protein
MMTASRGIVLAHDPSVVPLVKVKVTGPEVTGLPIAGPSTLIPPRYPRLVQEGFPAWKTGSPLQTFDVGLIASSRSFAGESGASEQAASRVTTPRAEASRAANVSGPRVGAWNDGVIRMVCLKRLRVHT